MWAYWGTCTCCHPARAVRQCRDSACRLAAVNRLSTCRLVLLTISVHKCQWWSMGDGGPPMGSRRRSTVVKAREKKLLRLQIRITVNAQTDHVKRHRPTVDLPALTIISNVNLSMPKVGLLIFSILDSTFCRFGPKLLDSHFLLKSTLKLYWHVLLHSFTIIRPAILSLATSTAACP